MKNHLGSQSSSIWSHGLVRGLVVSLQMRTILGSLNFVMVLSLYTTALGQMEILLVH